MYKINISKFTNEPCSVNRVDEDGIILISIPFDPANNDYQQYLAWIAEGNEPLPADEE